MTKIGITGALGFIGRAIAERALARGDEVRGMDLPERGQGLFGAGRASYQRGDVTDLSQVRAFCEGLDRVYHTAAIVKEGGEWSGFFRVNVLGADNVAMACKESGVRDLVHFSSVMVFGFDFPDGVTEEGPLDPAENPYCATKILSEEAVSRYHREGALDVFIIRPGDVYGPGSVPWTIRPVEMMRKGQWVYVDSRRSIFNHVYIDNLLDGIDLVIEARASGSPFTITDGARTTSRDFFSHYQRLLGKAFIPDLPRALAQPAASLASGLLSAVGKPSELNSEAVRYMLRRYAYGIDKIRSLGYAPRVSLEEGMERTTKWLREEGLVP